MALVTAEVGKIDLVDLFGGNACSIVTNTEGGFETGWRLDVKWYEVIGADVGVMGVGTEFADNGVDRVFVDTFGEDFEGDAVEFGHESVVVRRLIVSRDRILASFEEHGRFQFGS